jgi:SAM-dependent methyltransferase
MSDCYYDLVGLDNFYIRRRFDVLRRMSKGLCETARNAAEVGCGSGIVQRQIEDQYGIPVVGIDLNETALELNISRMSPLYCYDIHQRSTEFREKFDLILLCDVLEHIDDEILFLESVSYHLAPLGSLVINVPAWQIFYSEFDRIVGHFRRYTFPGLREVVRASGLKIKDWTYWGLPIMPLLAARKLAAGMQKTERGVVDSGLKPPGGKATNELLFLASQCEWIPQKLVGTSLLVILEKPA